MATTNHYADGSVTFTEAFAASGGTVTLPAPGAGRSWRIDHISVQYTTAVSVWSIDVQENGGTSCYKVGATSAIVPAFIPGPIATKINDQPKIVLATTGATACVVNVIASLVTSG